MRRFVAVYKTLLAKQRVLYAINIINHNGATLGVHSKKVWVEGYLETVTLLEVKMGLLNVQLGIIEILANNVLYFWGGSEVQSWQKKLTQQLVTPLFHDVKLTEKEIIHLNDLDSLPGDYEGLEVYDHYIMQIAGLDKSQVTSIEIIKSLVIQAFSFNANLEKIRSTDVTDKKSVELLLDFFSPT